MNIEPIEPCTTPGSPQAVLPDWDDTNLRRLLMAIIGQAAKDARGSDNTGQEAREWLRSKGCADMCEFIGLDVAAVHQWVSEGCPNWRASNKDKR